MPKIAHKLVHETAKEIAHEVYEVLATESNKFYKMYPNRNSFVSKNLHYFIGDARKALTSMLVPDSNGNFKHSEHIRDEIFEALCLEGEMKAHPTN